jgi:hypothetical protein
MPRELAFQLLVELAGGPYLLHSHHGGSAVKPVGVGEGRAIAESRSSHASWVARGEEEAP